MQRRYVPRQTSNRDIKHYQLPLSGFIPHQVMKEGDERLQDFIMLDFHFVISHLLHQVPWEQFALSRMEMELPISTAPATCYLQQWAHV